MRRLMMLLLIVLAKPFVVHGQEGWPDWLPPPSPPRPFWEVVAPPHPPADPHDFLIGATWDPDSSPRQFYSLFGRYNLSRETGVEAAQLRSSLETPALPELRESPYLSRDWKIEQALNLPLASLDSLFMFGQMNSGGDAFNNQRTTVSGKTGLGMKWSPLDGSELQVRTCRAVNYDDAWLLRAEGRSPWSVELQAKIAWFGPLQLQYAGEALPAVAVTERHSLLHDLKMAVPFGPNREVHLGAKYRWEETLSPTPWLGRTELYMGLKLQH